MTKIVILGAGEHGRKVEHYCRRLGHEVLGFLDDGRNIGDMVNDVPIIGPFNDALSDTFDDDVVFHVALGNPAQRKMVNERLKENRRRLATIIHPTAEIEAPSEIGEGCYIGAFSLVSVNVRIENYVTIHAHCSISADAHFQTAAWIASGCLISRSTLVGSCSFVGTGAIILPGKSIGSNSTIGAGSLVTKDIPENCMAYGSPCRVVKKNIQD